MQQIDLEIAGKECIKYHGKEKTVRIPEGITAIADSAFYFCDQVEQVILPEGIRRIGRHAFAECFRLQAVVFPNTLEVIGDSAFENCRALEEIVLPPGVVHVGRMAFAKCNSLKRAKLSDSLEVLQHGLFLGDISLREISLPKQLARVEDSVFYYCKSLEEIVLPERVADIYPNTFYECSGLKRGYIPGIRLQYYRRQEQLMFALLYLAARQNYSLPEQQVYEAFIWDFKEEVCERIAETSNYAALEGFLKLNYLKRQELENWIEQARRKGNVEFSARLLREKAERFPKARDMWEI